MRRSTWSIFFAGSVMVDDPYTYDLTDFAREFTWGMLFWNGAEESAQQMLCEMLGGEKTALAIVTDMGNRSLLDGIKAASRELKDRELRDHLLHFCKGFGILLGWRNLYVHGMKAVVIGDTVGLTRKMVGQIMMLRAGGRLKSINRKVELVEMQTFVGHAKALSSYASAILTALGMEDYGFSEMLEMPPPSLEKPDWPSAPQNSPYYLQE